MKYPNLRKVMPNQVQRHTSNQEQELKVPYHIVVETLKIYNNKWILKSKKDKDKVTYKDKLIRIIFDSSMETLKAQRV